MDKQGFGRLKRSVATESALSVVVPSFSSMRSLGGLGEERKLKEQEEEVEAQRI